MKDIEHNYKVGVYHTGRLRVTVSAHMVAVLIAEKLGLPMPERNSECEVGETDRGDEDGPDNMVWIGFDYRQTPTEGPVSITIPGPKPPPSAEPGQ